MNLAVELNPIQTIEINPDSRDVMLRYESLDDYNNGVSSVNAKHLKVTSTGGYEIKVKAADFTYDTDATGLNKINLSHIGLVTSGETKDKSYTPLTGLTKEDKQIVLSNYGGVNQEFDVTYSAKKDNEYLANNYVKGNQVKLHTTVTYTIVAK